MRTATPRRVMFVCTGNICRSPTAEGVLRSMAAERGIEIEVASSGTGDWHVGAPPDHRTQDHAKRRGYDLSTQRARQFKRRDFEQYDQVIALDAGHHEALLAMCPPAMLHRLHHAADYSAHIPKSGVPDPYSGSAADFETVLDMVEAMCEGILADRHGVE